MKGDVNLLAERDAGLWILAAAPAIWAVHFMACYITAAVGCGKFAAGDDSLWTVRAAIAVFTGVALAGIAGLGSVGLRWHRTGPGDLPHDADSPEDRRRFLGFSTLLLSGLSAVAVVYAALTAVFIGTCR
jgi:hypothetical protein